MLVAIEGRSGGKHGWVAAPTWLRLGRLIGWWPGEGQLRYEPALINPLELLLDAPDWIES